MNKVNINFPLKHNYHSFHLVQPSVWPLLTAISAGFLAFGAVQYMHYSIGIYFIFGFIHLILCLIGWWRDVIQESYHNHTDAVQHGLRLGFLLFIVSEVMFFFGFFWTFLHSGVSPTAFIGCQWPPKGIEPFNPWSVPLINTLVLLLSGASITWVHHAIIAGKRSQSHFGFLVTIFLAILFTGLQIVEYQEAQFAISDGVFGACFFLMTGFHGFHVVIGTIFIIVCYFRNYYDQLTVLDHLGFEMAAWYWHFVDVVWLFLFVLIYWWSSIRLGYDSTTFSSTLNF